MIKDSSTPIVFFLLLTTGLLISSCADSILVERNDIVGTWENRDGEFARGWMNYKHDGTWDSELVVIFSDESVAIVRLKGNWSLDGNRLLYETTWSSDERFPLYSGVDIIVAITQDRYDFRSSGDNIVLSRYRVE